MAVTLKEIAQYAGVSVGTASAALNNRSSVSPETKARVLDVAVSMGYTRQNRLPTHTDSHDVKVIGLLIKHDLGHFWEETNPFYSRIQLGVSRACENNRISLMVGTIDVDKSNRPVSTPAMISDQQIDGLILAGTFIDDTVTFIRRKTDLPIVLIDSYAKDWLCDSVVTDNVGGARQAVRHLIELGHHRIGLVGWNPQSPPSIQERRQGYLEAILEHSLEPYIVPSELSREGGEAGAIELLSQPQRVSAIFSCNDLTGFGVIAGAQKLGLSVPHDLSLIGFDNIDLSKEITPAMTTIHIHKSWMGVMGVQLLLDRVRNPERPVVTMAVSVDLVMRNSVSIPFDHVS
jgi:LacI family transcriptional regulator